MESSTAGAAVGRLEVVGRPVEGRHELRPDFASGLPGPRYGQKTNLTSGDLDFSQRSWVLWITSWLAAIDVGWVWDDLLALLALGLLLLAVDAGSGAPSPLAVVAGIGLGRFR